MLGRSCEEICLRGEGFEIKVAKRIEAKERIMACPLTLNNFVPEILIKRDF